ncbi:MAG: DMT family transporter [Candidatus Promineofilum sp.]|nr:DMT family transporter [Promineifilum sp.]
MRTTPLRLRSDLLLLLTAVIWGFAFVGQRLGMEHVGPLAFNATRFFIGGLVLLPVMAWGDRQRPAIDAGRRPVLRGGLLVGGVLFAAATLQQAGITFTTAGKAGFITSLYVVIVPLLGVALGHRIGRATWAGALLAAVGLYFLTMRAGEWRMAFGDLLVLVSAVLWAVHMLLLGRLSPGRDPAQLAFVQFMTCAALSGLAALLFETTTAGGLRGALPAILFTGVLSVGVGYTLQVAGQRHAPPADTAIILSLEAVFAVLAGRLLLGEQLTARALLGCGLMLAGILISQLLSDERRVARAESDERRVTNYE